MLLAQISTLHPPLLTLDMLRASRIIKALRVIIDPFSEVTVQGRWPTDSFIQAKKILRRWERDFGDLSGLRINLFAPGQRLYGLTAAKAHKITHRSVIVPDEIIGTIWSLPHPPSQSRTLALGQKALAPGTWHLNLASLFNDNLINHPSLGPITFDSERAYVIVLTSPSRPPIMSFSDLSPKQMRETPAWDTGAQIKFTIEGQGGLSVGAARLIKTMRGWGEGQESVRVWRHWNWGGQWAPRGGIRFDGLYNITTFSVHLSPPPTSIWSTAFTLVRQENQFPLASVLHIPTVEQFDDWEDFLALSEGVGKVGSGGFVSLGKGMVDGDTMGDLEKVMRKKALARADTTAVVEESLIDAVRMEDEDDAEERKDSGYFSLPRRSGGS